MPKFSYTVKDKEGKTYKNVIDELNQQTLVDKLQSQGYFIVNVKKLEAPHAKKKLNQSKKAKKFGHKNIKLEDLIGFAQQLATMLEAGVTLIRSIDVIQSQVESEKLSKILNTIKLDIEQGRNLSYALSKHPTVFSPFWVSLIEVGEASGTMPLVLNKLTFYLQQQASFKATIISGLIYPVILFIVAMGAVGFFAIFVGPRFESIFTSMNAELPLITKVLLVIFRFIKEKFFRKSDEEDLLQKKTQREFLPSRRD